jgi:glycosyltransferase involved in cell wall biosynthesis
MPGEQPKDQVDSENDSLGRSLNSKDVSAVICTMNSISGIRECLSSLRESGVGEIIVVDASSTDGTKEVALECADFVLSDPGTGLGRARNTGIERTTKPLILNMGSDNVLPIGELQKMIDYLIKNDYQGVSAQTVVEGDDWISKGLNAWRAGRFREGGASVIGTPTLFRGDLLRSNPYDPSRVFSDDSELCERWTREFGARFGISDAVSREIGKTSWDEVKIRCRMYGESDSEIYSHGSHSGWSVKRKLISLSRPMRTDFYLPLRQHRENRNLSNLTFLATFTSMRYASWVRDYWSRR